ncbi:MAG TPA: hypothetical protein VN325_33485 [Steroidobacteraceae bacterium]|nr:hypothetical protein [Steroidobacteraceae bacterium]
MNTNILTPVVATFPAFDSTRWALARQAREALDLDTLPSFDESVVLTSDHAVCRLLDLEGNETARKVIQFRFTEPVVAAPLALVPEPLTPARQDAAEALTRLAASRPVAAPARPTSVWSWFAGLFER